VCQLCNEVSVVKGERVEMSVVSTVKDKHGEINAVMLWWRNTAVFPLANGEGLSVSSILARGNHVVHSRLLNSAVAHPQYSVPTDHRL